MAGPAISILVPRPLDEIARAEIGELVGHLAEDIRGEDFWVDGRPFTLHLGPEFPGDLERYVEEGLAEGLGWVPRDAVVVVAMCNDIGDHRTLARIGIAIAVRLDGVIDFGGMVLPEPCLDGTARRSPIGVTRPAGLAGELVATSYLAANGTYATNHVGDPAFLVSWLGHPRFRLPK